MNRRNEKGFSLLELLVAMMIIAVLGTLGFNQVRKRTVEARYIKAKDEVKIMAEGLDQYYLKHGRYPDLGSWEAMMDPGSVLVKEDLIKTNMSAKDPFDQPYEAKSNRGSYEIKCLGAPDDQENHGPFSRTPGQVNDAAPAAGAAAGGDKAKAPEPGAPK
ncbi:MAG TPA: prepilin-type N-terminal cleavage/methylation domain-containing protein [Holophagaceae bacterium]|nr:prepilin-type N-terminal cleavage/methylation domain-containing protein [Holophagaceae bacterium]